MDVYFNKAYQDAPNACVDDITAPTFAGIATLVMQLNGAGRLAWLAATHALSPIYYDVYVQKDTATGLFSAGNLALSSQALTVDVYALKDLTPLQEGETYHFGVRARSAVGVSDANAVSLSGISSGVLTSTLANIANTLKSALGSLSGVEGQVGDVEGVTGEVEC